MDSHGESGMPGHGLTFDLKKEKDISIYFIKGLKVTLSFGNN